MRLYLPFLAFTLLTASAQAQDANEPVTGAPASCEELFTLSGFAEKGPRTRIETVADGCRITDFFAGSTDYDRFRIGMLTLVAPGLFDALAEDLPPPRANIAVTGIASAPRIDDPLLEYILEVQSQPFDVNLAYDWDEATGVLRIEEVSLSGALLGRLAFSAQMAGLDPDAFATARAGMPPDFVLREAEVVLDNKLLVASFIAPPVISTLSSDEDPRAQIARYQQMIHATLEGLPETLVDAGSKAVLAALVDSFPSPEGVYTIRLHSEEGIGLDALEADQALKLLTQPGAMTLEASHDP